MQNFFYGFREVYGYPVHLVLVAAVFYHFSELPHLGYVLFFYLLRL